MSHSSEYPNVDTIPFSGCYTRQATEGSQRFHDCILLSSIPSIYIALYEYDEEKPEAVRQSIPFEHTERVETAFQNEVRSGCGSEAGKGRPKRGQPIGAWCARALTENFELRDLVYNRVTKEDGAIRRVYKMNGVAMCEVAVPKLGDSSVSGYYISDWALDVLQFSDNECLNFRKFEGALKLDVGRVFPL